jgi:hypothetical protein
MIPRRIGLISSIIFGLFLPWLLILFLPVTAQAQVAGATLSGTVTDPSGAAVASAEINIRNTSTEVTRNVTTDSSGLYSAPNLLPGTYEVKISSPGFSTQVHTGLTLTVGASQALNVLLAVGAVSEQVQVNATAPTVELTSSAISAEVTATTVRELPLNGRDWTSLATLQPGVTAIHTQASGNSTASRGNRGFGNQLSDSGHRPGENNYRINGISVNDYSNEAPGSVLGINLGVDAIQEFSVVTSNYSAEYGRTSGAVINAIGRSGADQFHGDVYGFLRDSSFDSKNFFDSRTKPIPPFHRYQWGAAGGGPIRKSKTFVFGDYESIRQNKSSTFSDFVPSQNARNGILAAAGPPVASCPVGTTLFVPGTSNICVDNQVIPFLPLYPQPNNGLVGAGDTGSFVATGLTVAKEDYFTLRIDHRFSDKDSLAGSYFFDNATSIQPDALLASLNETATRRQMASIEETHIFNPTLVNTVRLGWSRPTGIVNQPVSALNPLANDPSLAAIPGKFAPILTVPGLSLMQGGFGAQAFFTHHFDSTQVYDDAFLTKGTHSLKFGFAFERLQYNIISALRQDGGFNFPSLQGFLTNHPTSVQLLNPNLSKGLGIRDSLFGGYLQDDWRVRTNITLNLGLRYEMATLPTEAHNGFGVIQNYFGGPTVVPVPHLWQRNATLRNFEPRVGFSWDPFKDGKTAVRGGFGIFDMLPLPYILGQTTSVAFPFAVSSSASGLPAGSFPSGAFGLISTNPKTFVSRFVDQDPHRSYGMNWNLNIQRSLGRNMSAMVGYVGSHSVHQPVEIDDSNMVPATLTSAGYLWPLPVGSGTKVNPNVGGIRTTFFDGDSHYSGLQAQFKETIGNSLQAQASYSWGRCFDNGSGAQIGDMYLNSIQSLINPAHDAYRNGACDFDIRHSFVTNVIWQLPSPKFSNGAMSSIVGGWELGGIITAATGSPFSVFIGGDALGVRGTAGTFSFPDRIESSACTSAVNPGNVKQYVNLNCFSPPVAPASFAAMCQPAAASVAAIIANTCMNLLGNAGRNQIYGPGLFDFDFSIFKNNYIRRISETFNVQLRFEFFNVLNHPDFQAPLDNSTLFNQDGTSVSGAGAIDSTSNDSREIQFGLKINW